MSLVQRREKEREREREREREDNAAFRLSDASEN